MNRQRQIALHYVNAEREARAMQLDRPGRLYPAEKRTAIKAAALRVATETASDIRSGRYQQMHGCTTARAWDRQAEYLRQNGHTEAAAAEIVAAMAGDVA